MFVGKIYVANARSHALSLSSVSLSHVALVRLACVCFEWEGMEGSRRGGERVGNKEGFVE